MDSLYQYAWLISVLPLIWATLVGIGLISVSQISQFQRIFEKNHELILISYTIDH